MNTKRNKGKRAKQPENELHATGVRSLARALGVAPSAVAKWKADDRWPFGDPPWPIDQVRQWRARTLEPNRNGGGLGLRSSSESLHPLTKAKIAWTVEGVRLRKLEREILEGRYVLRDAADDQMIALVSAIKAAMLSIPRNVSAALGACTTDLARADLLEERIIQVFNELANETEVANVSNQEQPKKHTPPINHEHEAETQADADQGTTRSDPSGDRRARSVRRRDRGARTRKTVETTAQHAAPMIDDA